MLELGHSSKFDFNYSENKTLEITGRLFQQSDVKATAHTYSTVTLFTLEPVDHSEQNSRNKPRPQNRTKQ